MLKLVVALSSVFVLIASRAAATPAVDPRPDPDACKLLSDRDLEPLLFGGVGGVLDSESLHPAPGLSICRWQAHPRNRSADAVPLTVTLAFYHLADASRAQVQLDRQPKVDARPSFALMQNTSDALVRPTATAVVARHDADVAVIDAAGAELAKPDQLEVRYLLDALALKAAGAAVKPPPWSGSEAGAPEGGASLADRAVEGWTPPPRVDRHGSGMLEPAIHGLHVLAKSGFWILSVAGPAAVLLFLFGDRRRRAEQETGSIASRRRRWWPTLAGGALLALALGNSLLGANLADALIDHYGDAGAAIVTGSFATGDQYNRKDVVGHRVLIRTIDGKTVSGEFRTDDFNVRPAGNAVTYPGPGDVFTVDYLPHHPGDFVIRADDASPWATKLACDRLSAWRAESNRRF